MINGLFSIQIIAVFYFKALFETFLGQYLGFLWFGYVKRVMNII